jgi:replicative DNA helicase
VLVALSQLNRSTEGREDKRPMLSDLRGSGSLEQDADIVFALYDEHYYEHEDDMPVVRDIDIAVVKNRDGPKGTAKVTMDFRTGRMMNDETN